MGEDFASQVAQKLSLLLNSGKSSAVVPIFFDRKGKRARRLLFIVLLITAVILFISIISYQFNAYEDQYERQIAKENYQDTLTAYPKQLSYHAFIGSNDSNARYSFRENIILLQSISIENAQINAVTGQIRSENITFIEELRTDLQTVRPDINEYLHLDLRNENMLSSWIDAYELHQDDFFLELIKFLLDNNYEGLSISYDWEKNTQESTLKILAELQDLNNILIGYDLTLQLISKNILHPFWSRFQNLTDDILIRIEPLLIEPISDVSRFKTLEEVSQSLRKILDVNPSLKPTLVLPTQSYSFNSQGIRQLSFQESQDFVEKGTVLNREPSGLFSFQRRAENENESVYLADAVTWNLFRLSLQDLLFEEALSGLAWPNLGSEDPATWNVFLSEDNGKTLEHISQHYYRDYKPRFRGEGDLWSFSSNDKAGLKEILWSEEDIVGQKIIDLPQEAVVSLDYFDAGITLTFDDGPHPKNTPRVLRVLKKHNAKAIFYVTGENALEYPHLIEQIHEQGHIVANHSFSHHNPYFLPLDHFTSEVITTSHIIESIIGVKPELYRPPFVTPYGYVTRSEGEKLAQLDNLGYRAAFFVSDSRDWEYGLNEDTTTRVLTQLSDKKVMQGQLLLHDGIRDIDENNLSKLITKLEQQGYILTALPNSTRSQVISLTAILVALRSVAELNFLRNSLSVYLACFILFTVTFHAVLFVLFFKSKVRGQRPFSLTDAPVSVLVPAYNEEKVIEKTIRSILSSNYDATKLEVIVIDDGSKDATWHILQNAFSKHKQVRMFRLKNGGKAKALNFGLTQCNHDLVACLDADTIMQENSLRLLTRHFQDKTVGGVAGNIRVGNRVDFLTMYQQLEYSLGQCLHKQAMQEINQVFVIPGATGVWRRKALLELGGFNHDTLAEDTDLTLRVITSGWRVLFERQGIGYTEAPDSWSDLIKQRLRWQFGSLQVLFKNVRYLFRRKGGGIGLFLIPMLLLENVFLATLPINFVLSFFVLGTWLKEIGLVNANLPNLSQSTLELLVVTWSISFLISLFAHFLALANEPKRHAWYLLLILPVSMVYYRTVLWGLQIVVIARALRGRQEVWGSIKRTGAVQYQTPVVWDAPNLQLPLIPQPLKQQKENLPKPPIVLLDEENDFKRSSTRSKRDLN